MFHHLLFQSVSQLVKSGSPPWFLLPAGPHQGVSTRRAVVRSLHAIASLHLLLHLVKSLATGTRVRDGDKEEAEFSGTEEEKKKCGVAGSLQTPKRHKVSDLKCIKLL